MVGAESLALLEETVSICGMNWTAEKPTAPGWYWYKNPAHGHDAEKDADIIEVDPVEDEALFPGETDPRSLALCNGEFAGPIPRPYASAPGQ